MLQNCLMKQSLYDWLVNKIYICFLISKLYLYGPRLTNRTSLITLTIKIYFSSIHVHVQYVLVSLNNYSSLLLVLNHVPGFTSQFSKFSSSLKKRHHKFQFTQEAVDEETSTPLLVPTYMYMYLFIYSMLTDVQYLNADKSDHQLQLK